MSATTSPTTDATQPVPSPIAAPTDAVVATVPVKAIALATTLVTSTLDGLESLRIKARGAATAGLDYSDTVVRNVSAASRRLVDQVDVATVAGLAKARTFAFEALDRARKTGPAAAPAKTAPVASA